jgi:hypothetical protein
MVARRSGPHLGLQVLFIFPLLTYNHFRSFHGMKKIRSFLGDRMKSAGLTGFALRTTGPYAPLQQPAPDLAWIYRVFDFETRTARGVGTFHLIPSQSGEWLDFTVLTTLHELKGFEEHIGQKRLVSVPHGAWAEKRRKESAFADSEPTVVVMCEQTNHCLS